MDVFSLTTLQGIQGEAGVIYLRLVKGLVSYKPIWGLYNKSFVANQRIQVYY